MRKLVEKQLALSLTALCVRNSFLEDIHAGRCVLSKTGDYSDVKVICPNGEIPWNKVSRISDEEMRKLMKEVADNIYSFLLEIEDPVFLREVLDLGRKYTHHWDEPKKSKLFKSSRRRRKAPHIDVATPIKDPPQIAS